MSRGVVRNRAGGSRRIFGMDDADGGQRDPHGNTHGTTHGTMQGNSQSNAASDVAKRIENIAQLAEETGSTMASSSASAQEVNRLAGGLSQTIGGFRV